MTSVVVEHSCSLSGAICNFLRIVIIIIILNQKLANDAIDHAWIYPPSTIKQRSCINMKTFFGHLFYSSSKLIQAFFVLCPFPRTQHLMHHSDLSESLKIRTTVCLICKQIRAVQTQFKKPSF